MGSSRGAAGRANAAGSFSGLKAEPTRVEREEMLVRGRGSGEVAGADMLKCVWCLRTAEVKRVACL